MEPWELQWPRWLLSSYSISWMSILMTLAIPERQRPCFSTSRDRSARPPHDRRGPRSPLHHRCTCRPLALTRRAQQRSPDQAVCASAACYRRFPASQWWHTDNVMPPWRPLFYRADSNAVASTTSHPTMTREATAPAVILAFSFVV